MGQSILQDIYNVVLAIRNRLEALEYIIVPEEKVTAEELEEIERLKEESLSGEHVDWDDLKRALWWIYHGNC